MSILFIYLFICIGGLLFFFLFFFWIRGNIIPWKTYFVGPGERVKSRLSQALTRGAPPDLNLRYVVQISSSLPSANCSSLKHRGITQYINFILFVSSWKQHILLKWKWRNCLYIYIYILTQIVMPNKEMCRPTIRMVDY